MVGQSFLGEGGDRVTIREILVQLSEKICILHKRFGKISFHIYFVAKFNIM